MCFFVFTLQFLLCLSVNLCAHEISFCIFIAKCKWVTRKIMCNKILFQAESHSSTYKKRNEEIGDIFFSWEFHKKYYTMIIITSSIVRVHDSILFLRHYYVKKRWLILRNGKNSIIFHLFYDFFNYYFICLLSSHYCNSFFPHKTQLFQAS